MKAVFGTVIYNQAMEYAQEFIESINNQVDQEFEVLIVNDNVKECEAQKLAKKIKYPLNIINKPYKMGIAELRIFLIDIAKKLHYNLLVLGDFDDCFSNNRVKEVVQKYDNDYTFFYNQIITFEGHELFEYLPKKLLCVEDIIESNFLGLSNTAINLDMISTNFIESLKEAKTNIFDWYLYTRLLMDGKKGKFIDHAKTIYRIHDNNLAGLEKKDDAQIEKEIRIKLEHYNFLKNRMEIFQELYEKYSLDDVKNFINENNEGYWWGCLKTRR